MRPKFILTMTLLMTASFALAMTAVTFKNQKGESINMEQHIGQNEWLLVEYWGSFCAVCEQHQAEIVALNKDYRDKGLKVIAVAVDGVQARPQVDSFIRRHGIEHPVMIDDGSAAAEFYASVAGQPWKGATPTYLLFKPSGELIGQNYGAMGIDALLAFIDKNGGM